MLNANARVRIQMSFLSLVCTFSSCIIRAGNPVARVTEVLRQASCAIILPPASDCPQYRYASLFLDAPCVFLPRVTPYL